MDNPCLEVKNLNVYNEEKKKETQQEMVKQLLQ